MKGFRAAVVTLVAIAAVVLAAASPLRAQQPDTLVVAPTVQAPTQTGVDLPDVSQPTSPGGAFIRALILPGWGHAAIGSYTRGGFYFLTETTTAFMLLRTQRRIDVAKAARDLEEERAFEALRISNGDLGADSIRVLIGRDSEVLHTRHLVDARRQQRQDWAALGVFLLFISAADAFVSAHLRDFPAPVNLSAVPLPGGGTALGFSVAVGGSPDH